MPWPKLDLPWGYTDAFEEAESVLVGIKEPTITIVGESTKSYHEVLSSSNG